MEGETGEAKVVATVARAEARLGVGRAVAARAEVVGVEVGRVDTDRDVDGLHIYKCNDLCPKFDSVDEP